MRRPSSSGPETVTCSVTAASSSSTSGADSVSSSIATASVSRRVQRQLEERRARHDDGAQHRVILEPRLRLERQPAGEEPSPSASDTIAPSSGCSAGAWPSASAFWCRPRRTASSAGAGRRSWAGPPARRPANSGSQSTAHAVHVRLGERADEAVQAALVAAQRPQRRGLTRVAQLRLERLESRAVSTGWGPTSISVSIRPAPSPGPRARTGPSGGGCGTSTRRPSPRCAARPPVTVEYRARRRRAARSRPRPRAARRAAPRLRPEWAA